MAEVVGARPVTATVRVDNLARIPAGDLRAAESEASRIFNKAGIEIEWVEGGVMTGPGRLTVILVNISAGAAGESGDAAGAAVRTVSRAYVYCDRLRAVADHAPVDANALLGRVIAHEIGHLLLPPNSHTRLGIMRPFFDSDPVGLNAFTSDQAEALHRALAVVLAKK